jgi:hypothetical protein
MADRAALAAESQPTRQETSRYALVYGVRRTRQTLHDWQHDPWPALRRWFAGSFAIATCLLLAVWAIAGISNANGLERPDRRSPPFAVGTFNEAVAIFERNLLVLALHAMACVAGFIAGSSLPLQAERHTGSRADPRARRPHRDRLRDRRDDVLALGTGARARRRGGGCRGAPAHLARPAAGRPDAARSARADRVFLPLAAWIIASRRGEWDQLLAATVVTVIDRAADAVRRRADRGLRLAPRPAGADLTDERLDSGVCAQGVGAISERVATFCIVLGRT